LEQKRLSNGPWNKMLGFSLTDGTDVTGKTILERRARLEKIHKPAVGIQLGSYVEGEEKALFDLTKEKGRRDNRDANTGRNCALKRF